MRKHIRTIFKINSKLDVLDQIELGRLKKELEKANADSEFEQFEWHLVSYGMALIDRAGSAMRALKAVDLLLDEYEDKITD